MHCFIILGNLQPESEVASESEAAMAMIFSHFRLVLEALNLIGLFMGFHVSFQEGNMHTRRDRMAVPARMVVYDMTRFRV